MQLIRLNLDSKSFVPPGCFTEVTYVGSQEENIDRCIAYRWHDDPWRNHSLIDVSALNKFLANTRSSADVPLLSDMEVLEPSAWTRVRPVRFEIEEDILALFRLDSLNHFTPDDLVARKQREDDNRTAAESSGWYTISPGDWDLKPGCSLLTKTGRRPLGLHTHFPPGLFGRHSPGLRLNDVLIGRDDEISMTGHLWGYEEKRIRATLWCEVQ